MTFDSCGAALSYRKIAAIAGVTVDTVKIEREARENSVRRGGTVCRAVKQASEGEGLPAEALGELTDYLSPREPFGLRGNHPRCR